MFYVSKHLDISTVARTHAKTFIAAFLIKKKKENGSVFSMLISLFGFTWSNISC